MLRRMPPTTHTGSCLCNAVRLTVAGPPTTVCVCHCALCRRAVGSPGVPWASFRRAGLVVAGAPSWYRSSEHARRGFCGACGTSLFFESTHEPDTIDIAVAALHDADKLAPRFHEWTNSKLAWEMIADKLPRFREGGGSLKMT